MKSFKFAVALAVVGMSCSVISNAQVINSTTGAIVIIPTPPSVNNNVLTSNTNIYGFLEQQNVTLGSNLALDAKAIGVFGAPGTVLAGTAVNSFLLHTQSASGSNVYDGSITFANTILGYIYTSGSLAGTNVSLGSGTTTYDTGFQGLESPPNDVVALLPSRHTLVFHSSTGSGIDEVRIITSASSSAPEASSIAMMALGSLPLIYGIRRRIRKA